MANVPYSGVIFEFTKDADVLLNNTDSDKFKPVTGLISNQVSNFSYTKYFRLESGITKFRVYILKRSIY